MQQPCPCRRARVASRAFVDAREGPPTFTKYHDVCYRRSKRGRERERERGSKVTDRQSERQSETQKERGRRRPAGLRGWRRRRTRRRRWRGQLMLGNLWHLVTSRQTGGRQSDSIDARSSRKHKQHQHRGGPKGEDICHGPSWGIRTCRVWQRRVIKTKAASKTQSFNNVLKGWFPRECGIALAQGYVARAPLRSWATAGPPGTHALGNNTFRLPQFNFRERRGHSFGDSLREEPEVIDRKLAHVLVSRRIPLHGPA